MTRQKVPALFSTISEIFFGNRYSRSEGYEEEVGFEVVVKVGDRLYRNRCITRRRRGCEHDHRTATDVDPLHSPTTLDVTPFEEVIPAGIRKLYKPAR